MTRWLFNIASAFLLVLSLATVVTAVLSLQADQFLSYESPRSGIKWEVHAMGGRIKLQWSNEPQPFMLRAFGLHAHQDSFSNPFTRDDLNQPDPASNTISGAGGFFIARGTSQHVVYGYPPNPDRYDGGDTIYYPTFPAIPMTVVPTTTVFAPLWAIFVCMTLLPFWRLNAFRKERARTRTGLCTVCGYDLRASSERCPECGTLIRAMSEAAA